MNTDDTATEPATEPAAEAPDDAPIDRPLAARDFDFLVGQWRVHHKRLKERLVGSVEWTEFETGHECGHMLGGLGNIDRQWGEFAGAYYEGVSVRSFAPDPAHARGGEWLIYWMDTGNPAPAFQVRGNFPGREGGQDGEAGGEAGEFFGEEEIDGIIYPLRFRWWNLSDKGERVGARWDQALKLPDSEEWEVNWVMEFERIE